MQKKKTLSEWKIISLSEKVWVKKLFVRMKYYLSEWKIICPSKEIICLSKKIICPSEKWFVRVKKLFVWAKKLFVRVKTMALLGRNWLLGGAPGSPLHLAAVSSSFVTLFAQILYKHKYEN